jgi:hypothetical protein
VFTLSLRRSLKGTLLVLGGGLLAASCSQDWDALDPRLGAAPSSGTTLSGASSTASNGTGSGGTGASGGGSPVGPASTGSATGSAAGSGGGGGSVLGHCGGTNTLFYDFADGKDPADLFSLNIGGNAVPTQSGGEGVITLPSAQVASSFGSFSTLRRYNVLSDRLFVKVTTVPDITTTAAAALELISSTNADYIGIQEAGGSLHFAAYLGGVYTELLTATYDPTTDVYWSISEDGMGNTLWETSVDGVTFTKRAQKKTSDLTFSLATVGVQFSAQSMGSETNPGSAHFDDVNGGVAATGKWCPASSFSDNFDDMVANPVWGRKFADPNVAVTESGGMLEVSLSSNVIGYGAYMSNVSFDLVEDAIVVQITSPPNATTSAQAYLRAETDADNGVDVLVQGGVVSFRRQVDSTILPLATTPFSASTNWVRIRETGGMTSWEASPDGKTWTLHAVRPDPIDMSRVDIRIGAGAYEAVTSPGTAKFDNYNLPPP